MAVINSPIQPYAEMPSSPNNQLPTKPPIIPRKRLTKQPLPSPFAIDWQYSQPIFHL